MSGRKFSGFGQKNGKFGRRAPFSDLDGRAVYAYLRVRFPQKTAESVAAATGVPAATVRKWESSAPSYAHLLRLIAWGGPEFLVSVMPSSFGWLDAAAQAERAARLDAQIAELRRQKQHYQNGA